MKARNERIDVLRGIAVASVLICHAVQRALPDGVYENNAIYVFTCRYHMPLFFIISGYLLAFSNKSNSLKFVLKKISTLIIPTYIWHYILFFVHKYDFAGIKRFRKFPNTVKEYTLLLLKNPIYVYWFLWVTFIFIIIVLCVEKLFKENEVVKSLFLFAIASIICRCKILSIYLGSGYLIKYIPFFVLGYLISKWYLYFCHKKGIGFFLIYASAVMMELNNDNIYTGYYVGGVVLIHCAYVISGLIVKYCVWIKNILATEGRYSLEIYLSSLCIMNLGVGTGMLRIVSIFLSVSIICTYFAIWSNRNDIIRKVLWGKFIE